MLKKYLPRILIAVYASALLVGTRAHAPNNISSPLREEVSDKNDACEKELRRQHIYWSTLNEWLGYYTHCIEGKSLRFAERIYLYSYALKAENPKLSEEFLLFCKNYSEKLEASEFKTRINNYSPFRE